MNELVTFSIADSGLFWGLIIVAFFGILLLTVWLVKRKVKPLQIKKDEMTEEEAAKAELDRILVPVDDETQKIMEEEAKKHPEDDK